MRMCRPAFLRMRPVLPEGAAPPGHNQDPSPRWAGTWHSRALPTAEMLLARSGAYRWDLATWCQRVPTTASQGHGSAPARPPGAGPGDSWKMPLGAMQPVLQDIAWHLGVLLCLPAASRASPPAAARWGTGDICCFFTPRKQHLLGSLLSPRQAGGEPTTPVPPTTSLSAPCPQRGSASPSRLWAPTGGRSSGAPRDGTAAPRCRTSRESQEQLSQPRCVPGPSLAPAPTIGTRRRLAPHTGEVPGPGGSLMDIHEQRVR